jgi:hypothetical protein
VDELKLRDPIGEGTAGENYYVALISELDTYYGRALPKAFMRAAGLEHGCEDDAAEVVAQIKHLIQDVESLREGAFVPLLEQPFIAAGLLPFASVGGLQLVQVLGLVH